MTGPDKLSIGDCARPEVPAMSRLTRDQLETAKVWMGKAELMLPLLDGWEAQIFRNVMAEWAKCNLTQDDFEILGMLIGTAQERRRLRHARPGAPGAPPSLGRRPS